MSSPIFFPPKPDDLFCSSLSILMLSPHEWIHTTHTLTVLSASCLSKNVPVLVGAPVQLTCLNPPLCWNASDKWTNLCKQHTYADNLLSTKWQNLWNWCIGHSSQTIRFLLVFCWNADWNACFNDSITSATYKLETFNNTVNAGI